MFEDLKPEERQDLETLLKQTGSLNKEEAIVAQ